MSAYDNLRRLTLPTPNPKRQKYQHLWLDLLPNEICERIVSFLPCNIIDRGRHSSVLPDALSLASVSAVQAVAVGRQTHLCIEHATSPQHTATLIREWLDILRNVVSVHLPVEISDNYEIRNILSLQSVRKISVPNYPLILRQLPNLHFLRCLELRLTMYRPENGKKGMSRDLSTVLRTCPIEELRIICLGCYDCPYLQCFTMRLFNPLKAGRQCMTLKSLMIKCASNGMEPIAEIPAVFPNLEFFHMEHWASVDHHFLDRPIQTYVLDPILAHLQRIKNVTVHNCGNVSNFLPNLAQNLYGLKSIVEETQLDFEMLAECTNLRSIDLLLREGTEIWFPRELQRLRSLSLSWESKKMLALHEKYYAPIGEIISGIISRNSDLEELRLKNVFVSPDLLEEFLRTIGSKLKSLHIPVLHQGETSSARVLRLGRLLLRHNDGLETLSLCSTSFRRIAKTRVTMNHEWRICNANICELCELRKNIEIVRGVLRWRSSGFCDEGLTAVLFQLEPLC